MVPAQTNQTLRIAGDQQKAIPRKIVFTKEALAQITVPAGKDRVWVYDISTPNLCFTRTAGGKTSFYFYGFVNGRPLRYRLGKGSNMTVAEAREAARKVDQMRFAGEDPQAKRKQDRVEMTLQGLFDWYIENHAKPNKRTWQADQKKFDFHLKDLAGRKVSGITKQDIADLHRKIGAESPGSANRTLALISSIFGRARALDVIVTDNPAKGVQRFPEHQRERFLLPDEMERFIVALDATPQPWADIFRLCLFTGARRANVLAMRWEEFDLEAAVWRIPGEKFKNGQPQSVHLPAAMVELLRGRQRNKSEWVFPGGGRTGHAVEPRKPWENLLKRARLNDLRIHDLRRSLGSWMASTGTNQAVIGKSLGHRSQATTARYTRSTLDPVRHGVDTAVAAMLEAARPKPKE